MANEYIEPEILPGLKVCVPCPANSTSMGGGATNCSCNPGTGRVNDTDVTLPCLGEYLPMCKCTYHYNKSVIFLMYLHYM